MIKCNNCGYPVIAGMHYCPNCNAEVIDGITNGIKEELVATPPVEEKAVTDVVEDEIPICTLLPRQQSGEKVMREETYEVKDDKNEVMLARTNTVPHDTSIDEKQQACLFFDEGHWWIQDCSRDESTFVHAGAGIKLEPGDIIRLGTREFVFNIKTRKK